MKISELGRFALCGVAASMITSCAGVGAPATGAPGANGDDSPLGAPVAGVTPTALKRGLYVSTSDKVLGYRADGRGPICTVHGAAAGGIAADGDGNLLDTDGGGRKIVIFRGPKMCGRKLGSIADPYGQPSDVSSVHAATGTIALANIFDTGGAGSVSVCTMSGGCTANLTNANMYEVGGVAMDKSGNCWASATNSAGAATLTYFAGCSGSGEAATGYLNAYDGGLDIDGKGDLLALSAFDGKLYVYRGCKPTCTPFAGPFALMGEAFFGHLNGKSTEFAAADYENASIDVYGYSSKGLTYEYSFNNGLSGSFSPEGVTYNVRANR
jgi:hypothetical protein